MTLSYINRVVIIGAGMSGLGAAIKLLEHNYSVTVIEAAPAAGGLASSFKINGKYFNLGYHHILAQDKPLHRKLKKLELWKRVVWKKGSVFFAFNGKIYNLQNPKDFLAFPLQLWDKIRFVALMIYCAIKRNWSKDLGDAETWLDRIAGKSVRAAIFDPLVDVKYGLTTKSVSANWLGSRLHYQEFSRPLGYIPGTDWTYELTSALVRRIKQLGGTVLTNAPVSYVKLKPESPHTITYAHEGKEETILADIMINTAPPHLFLTMSGYRDEVLPRIEYLDALSLIVETDQKMPRDFYLLSCLRPRYSFGGIFSLSNLNKTLGVEEKTVLNFFTTLSPGYEYLRHKSAEELLEIYQKDFETLFGFHLKPLWYHLTLIKNYSPKFLSRYRNITPRGAIRGLYFAGNYMTYPLITSTGSAIASGETAAQCIMEDCINL